MACPDWYKNELKLLLAAHQEPAPVTPPVVLILARVVAVSKHEKSKGACRARKPTITLKLAEQTEPKIPVEVKAEE